ncbi:hypothetical protein BDW71DRAFT_30613 [Aspergillus fruticulosus]
MGLWRRHCALLPCPPLQLHALGGSGQPCLLVLICFCWIREVQNRLMLALSLGPAAYSSHDLVSCPIRLLPLPLNIRHDPSVPRPAEAVEPQK